MAPAKDNKPTASSSAPAEKRLSGLGDAYQLTAAEEAAFSRLERRRSRRHPAPRVKIAQGEDGATLTLEHERQDIGYRLLAEALGTADSDFLNGLLNQLGDVTRPNGKVAEKVVEAQLNFLLAVIKDFEPRDQCEAMLAAQMAVIHRAMMTFVARLGNVERIDQQDSALNGLTKLARSFAMLVETFKRYRTGGEQKVTVQHVNVNEGAQAIVGNVTTQSGTRTAAAQTTASAPARTPSATSPKPNLRRRSAAPGVGPRSRKNGRRSSA
ncbi:hypothetical protein AMST5_03855 [freshwater sediment metagenome]|uniref:Uncharacterized protein n=1 Tax=freshwater sediment metagenome TaxID=556182 RepID=A0AA48M4M3_9ZZZZ